MQHKLAMIRQNEVDTCPFGLDIPSACTSIGSFVHNLAPLDAIPDLNSQQTFDLIRANQTLAAQQTNNGLCPFASEIISNMVECEYQSDDRKSSALLGSPYYQKLLSNTSLTGLYNYPTGTVSDVSLNPGPLAGNISFEGIASVNNSALFRKSLHQDPPMPLAKVSQLNLDGIHIKPENLSMFDDLKDLADDEGDLRVDLEISPETEKETISLEDGGELHGELVIDLGEEEIEKEFSYTLPKVPGADNQEDIEEPNEIKVEDENEVMVESDPWKWKLENFMEWLSDKMQHFPPHSGKDVVGLERTVAYMRRLVGEIRKAIHLDHTAILDVVLLEKARDELLQGIKRCEDRIESIERWKRPVNKGKSSYQKAAGAETGMVKEGQKAGGFSVNVEVLISGLARIIINSSVSGGHDPKNTFDKLAKKFDLTKREKFELLQVLADMGMVMHRDRGFLLDEEIDYTSSDNFDFAANFPA